MEPIASTTYGRVRGIVQDGVFSFRGIPYAAPPVGPLRFAPPAAPAPWDGERDATRFGVTAPQHRPGGAAGDLFAPSLPSGEDCLTINVWTPSLDDARLPVLVWVHGGGFLFGTSAGPLVAKGSFARHGVVTVTMNYRLGVDGFLLVDDDPDGGNYGMLDIVAALRWVQENVAAFGGDPARVTLAGQSAGSTAVGALVGAPSAQGLVARAIVTSGYPDPLLSTESAAITAREIYERLGLPQGDVEVLRNLREDAPDRILAAQKALFEDVGQTRDADRYGEEIAISCNPFQPVVGTPFLPRRPVEALRDGEAGRVPLMIGHNREEFRLMYGIGMLSLDLEMVAAVFERALPGRGGEALELYRSTRPDASPVELLAALETDRVYRTATTRYADAHADGGAATFFYRFAWQSTAFDGAIGAGHSVDQPFVFDALDLPEGVRLTGEDPPQRLADDLHGAWLAFVETGDPGHADLPDWPRYDARTRAMLEFGPEPRINHDPEPAELELWSPHAVDAA